MGKGTGLGLTTAYGIVVSHKGAITVSSTNAGTEFQIYLPSSPSKLIGCYDKSQGVNLGLIMFNKAG